MSDPSQKTFREEFLPTAPAIAAVSGFSGAVGGAILAASGTMALPGVLLLAGIALSSGSDRRIDRRQKAGILATLIGSGGFLAGALAGTHSSVADAAFVGAASQAFLSIGLESLRSWSAARKSSSANPSSAPPARGPGF